MGDIPEGEALGWPAAAEEMRTTGEVVEEDQRGGPEGEVAAEEEEGDPIREEAAETKTCLSSCPCESNSTIEMSFTAAIEGVYA